MTTKSPDDAQGGYGTPAPEDEVPDANQASQGHQDSQDSQASKSKDTELDPEALGANNGLQEAGDETTDPILQPHDPSDGHLETDGVSEEDLKESFSVDPPD